MSRGDVSFTFLDRIKEIEWNIKDGRWQSALALALTLPDICGGIEYPEMVKRYRDGRTRTDKYGNPSRDIGNQYVMWFDNHAASFFYKNEEDTKPYIDGERCWQLRCEYLHQNKGFVNLEDGQEIHFHLGINCGTSICQFEQTLKDNEREDIRLDIEQFCYRMCLAVRKYYEENHLKKDFSLYNTPVIDFIEWSNAKDDNKMSIIILMKNMTLAKGIQSALEHPVRKIYVYDHVRDAKKRAAGKKISTWIVEDEFLKNNEELLNVMHGSKMVNVHLGANAYFVRLENEEVFDITMPCSLEILRNVVLS